MYIKQLKSYFITILILILIIPLNSTAGDQFRDMQITSDNNFIFGSKNIQKVEKQGAWLVKTDTSGDVIWSKTYCNYQNIVINAVKQTPDSGYICTGTYQINPGDDDNIFLLKTNYNGDSIWFTTFGGANDEIAIDLEIIDGGNFFITGSKYSSANKWDINLIKTTNTGSLKWSNTYGDTLDDMSNACALTDKGDILITGKSSGKVILLKVDTAGTDLWAKTYFGGTGYDLKSLRNGNFVLTGASSGQLAFIMKADSPGNKI